MLPNTKLSKWRSRQCSSSLQRKPIYLLIYRVSGGLGHMRSRIPVLTIPQTPCSLPTGKETQLHSPCFPTRTRQMINDACVCPGLTGSLQTTTKPFGNSAKKTMLWHYPLGQHICGSWVWSKHFSWVGLVNSFDRHIRPRSCLTNNLYTFVRKVNHCGWRDGSVGFLLFKETEFVPSTYMGPQQPVTPAPGNSKPSSGLHMCTYTHR